MDGCHGGSHTSSTATEVTPGTAWRIAASASVARDSPSGQAGDVIVIATRTAPPRTSTE